MHGPINVKSPNNTSKWQMGFNSAFKGLRDSELWGKKTLISKELHNLYTSPYIVRWEEAAHRTHGIIKIFAIVVIQIGVNPAARTIIDARIILNLILKKWDGRS
jgi:hypothetical protein